MKTLQNILLFMTSGFGIGWLPAGGTIISIPVAYAIHLFALKLTPYMNGEKYLYFIGAYAISVVVAGGIFSAIEEDRRGRVVVDHIWGMLISLLFIPLSWKTVVMAFVLFRFFEIAKPWPAYKFANIHNGFATILDDVVCGLMACLSLHGILYVYNFIMSYL